MNETAKRRNGETAKKPIRHFRELDVYQRRYRAAFVAKLSDAEGEAAETQVHLEFAFRHRYIGPAEFGTLDDACEKIIGQLVRMIDQPEKWLIKNSRHRL